jgi:hypothetical protein
MKTKLYQAANVLTELRIGIKSPSALLCGVERGDADSAGSTLRTIMVVVVVAAVVGLIGAAVQAGGQNAAACITNKGQGC